jgi:channel protein (hemolysin III family)
MVEGHEQQNLERELYTLKYQSKCLETQKHANANHSNYTWMEQVLNITTHLIPAFIAMVFTFYTLQVTRTPLASFTVLVYGIGIIICYICSSAYHVAGILGSKNVPLFLLFDYSAIFINIAASFTPWSMFVLSNHVAGNIISHLIWGLAIFGIMNTFIKMFPTVTPVMMYPIMVSLAFPMLYPLVIVEVNILAIAWLIVGLVWFGAGFTFFHKDGSLPYAHAIFHTFVVIGNFSQWYGIYAYVL